MPTPEEFGAVAVNTPESFGATPVESGFNPLRDIEAGAEQSATGLFIRGRLPDIELDPQHARWYDKALETIGEVGTDVPLMAASAYAAKSTGVRGMYAAANAVPTEIRESLIKAYQSGEADNSTDFLDRARIIIKGLTEPEVLKATAKAGTVGALTGQAGLLAKPFGGLAQAGAEYGTLSVVPAALDGRLPEPDDFMNAGLVLVGLRGAKAVASKIANVYAKTGIPPEQVVADAKTDPEIETQLKEDTIVPRGTITFVRHGATDLNDGNKIRGWLDVPLNDSGREDAVKAGVEMAKNPPDVIVSSDLGRARETADIISDHTGIPMTTELGLRPWNLGDLAGQNAEKVAPIIRRYAEEHPDVPVPGGESFNQFRTRFISTVRDIASKYPEQNVALITHHRGLRLMDAWQQAGGKEDMSINHDVFSSIGSDTGSNEVYKTSTILPKIDTDIPTAYQEAAIKEAVKNGVPDPKTDAQHALNLSAVMVKPLGEVPAEKLPNYLNFKYINSPLDVKGYNARISEIFGDQIESARGTESWDKTKEKATKIISDWATQSGRPISIPNDPIAFKDLAAKQMASIAMTQRAAYDIKTAAEMLEREGGDTPENTKKMIEAIETARMIQAIDQGNAAEIARAQNARKAARQVKLLTDQYLSLKAQYGDDPVQLARMIGSLDTTAKISRFVNGLEPLTTIQKIQQYYRFSLLTGATVFQVKGVGDLLMSSERLLRRYVSAAVGKLPGRGNAEDTFEAANAMLYSTFQGVRDGLNAMVETWKAANGIRGPNNVFGYTPVFGMKEGQAPKAGSAADLANKVLALPHRIIASETELFRVLNERGEIGRLAHLQAVEEGFKPGTNDYASRLTEIQKNPTKEMIESAKLAGDEGTFTSKLGKTGQLIQKFSNTDIGGFIVPFARVPINIENSAIKDMPAIALLRKDVQAEWKSGKAGQNMVIARQIIGGAVAALAFDGVLKGTITGGSQWMSPNQKQARLDAGIQDYSFKFPWSDTWHTYDRYQPLGTIMQVTTDLAEIYQHAEEDDKAEIYKLVAASIGHAAISQPYFEGINQAFQAITNPSEGERWYDSFIGSFVPSFLAQVAAAKDPYQRQIDGLFDEIKSRLPYLRETLAPKMNTLTGEPLENTHGLALSHAMTESKDPVLTEAARLNVSVSKAPKKIQLAAMGQRDIGAVELTPEQQSFFASEAGKFTHEILSQYVGTDEWKELPDLVKAEIYKTAIKKGHDIAKAEVLTPEQRALELDRISTEIQERLNQ